MRTTHTRAILGLLLVCPACSSPFGAESPIKAIVIVGQTNLEVGQVVTLHAIDESGASVPPPSVKWSSSTLTVAAVTGDGLVTALSPGRTTITIQTAASAQSTGLTASATVTVTPGTVAYLTISGPDVLQLGEQGTLSVTGFNLWDKPITSPQVFWISARPEVVSISSSSGVMTAQAIGVATITAWVGKVSQPTLVTVSQLMVFPRGEFGDTILLAPGQSLQLSAHLFREGSPSIVPTVPEWSSTQTDVAAVSPAGLVTAGRDGTADIRARVPGLSATRIIRTAPTIGTVSARLIHAADGQGPLSVRPNSGSPVTLDFGASTQLTFPAGTLQLTVDGIQPIADRGLDPGMFALHQFTGFLPAGTMATFVVMGSSIFGPLSISIVPLWDRSDPVHPDSIRVRAVLTTTGGHNIYFTPPGGPIGGLFLNGCYLDWPYGVSDYASRLGAPFDVVLDRKDYFGIEVARRTVSPLLGKSSTIVVTGRQVSSLRVLLFQDP